MLGEPVRVKCLFSVLLHLFPSLAFGLGMFDFRTDLEFRTSSLEFGE